MHPVFGSGDVSKHLGARFDCKLLMADEVTKILRMATPKIAAILRCRCFYSTTDLLQQFKNHVWPILDGTAGAIYHASTVHLAKKDRIQVAFLKELGLSEEVALLEFNVAPTNMRRDIAMHGLLFKIASGLAHPAFSRLFPRAPARNAGCVLRHDRHQLQLRELVLHSRSSIPGVVHRNLFGLVRISNRLDRRFFEVASIDGFQRRLTEHCREACRRGDPQWQSALARRTLAI